MRFVKEIGVAIVALLLVTGTASAADVFQPEVDQTTVYNWSGIYAGLSGGYAFGDGRYAIEEPDIPVDPFRIDDQDGAVVGGHLGFNYQVAPWAVIGAELDGGYSWIDAERNYLGVNFETNTDWFFLAKGRAGFAYDRFLAFGTLGYAGVNSELKGHQICPGQCVGHSGADSGWKNGWTVGAGAEYAIADNLVIGAAWDHVMINDAIFEDKVLGHNVRIDEDSDFDLFRVRASVKF